MKMASFSALWKAEPIRKVLSASDRIMVDFLESRHFPRKAHSTAYYHEGFRGRRVLSGSGSHSPFPSPTFHKNNQRLALFARKVPLPRPGEFQTGPSLWARALPRLAAQHSHFRAGFVS